MGIARAGQKAERTSDHIVTALGGQKFKIIRENSEITLFIANGETLSVAGLTAEEVQIKSRLGADQKLRTILNEFWIYGRSKLTEFDHFTCFPLNLAIIGADGCAPSYISRKSRSGSESNSSTWLRISLIPLNPNVCHTVNEINCPSGAWICQTHSIPFG